MLKFKQKFKHLVMPEQGYSTPKLFSYKSDLHKEGGLSKAWYIGFRYTCPVRALHSTLTTLEQVNSHQSFDVQALGYQVIKRRYFIICNSFIPLQAN